MAEQLVLVVEDHKPIATLLCHLAERCGARALVAEDGRQALAMIRAERPALVLLDLTMPIMSGQEVLAVMETDPELRDVPVVVISTSENVDDALERKVPHLSKPFDPSEVERLIRLTLAGSDDAA